MVVACNPSLERCDLGFIMGGYVIKYLTLLLPLQQGFEYYKNKHLITLSGIFGIHGSRADILTTYFRLVSFTIVVWHNQYPVSESDAMYIAM